MIQWNQCDVRLLAAQMQKCCLKSATKLSNQPGICPFGSLSARLARQVNKIPCFEIAYIACFLHRFSSCSLSSLSAIFFHSDKRQMIFLFFFISINIYWSIKWMHHYLISMSLKAACCHLYFATVSLLRESSKTFWLTRMDWGAWQQEVAEWIESYTRLTLPGASLAQLSSCIHTWCDWWHAAAIRILVWLTDCCTGGRRFWFVLFYRLSLALHEPASLYFYLSRQYSIKSTQSLGEGEWLESCHIHFWLYLL